MRETRLDRLDDSPPQLLSELARLQAENAMLRHALEERGLPPRARRWIGSVAAVIILAAGAAAGAFWATHSREAVEYRDAIMTGYRATSTVGPRAPVPVPVPSTPPSAPIPPAAPRPRTP